MNDPMDRFAQYPKRCKTCKKTKPAKDFYGSDETGQLFKNCLECRRTDRPRFDPDERKKYSDYKY